VAHFVNRLRGLRCDPETRMFHELQHVFLVQYHIELGQVFGQTTHLHVIAFANDDRVKAFANEFGDRTMGHMHERTSGLDDVQAGFTRPALRLLGSAVSRDHDRLRRDA
jgi:hypothetical protein